MRRIICVGLLAALVSVGFLSVRPDPKAIGQQPNETENTATTSEEEALIVHEWGTFTTFSGSDGVFLDFRPLANEVSDLPSFVRDRANSSAIPVLSKKRLRGRVRMETPVTYFYTDKVRDVEVKVGFPQGLLTEFYPPVKKMLPEFDPRVAYSEGEPLGDALLDWGTVTLIPPSALAPNLANDDLRARLSRHLANQAVPSDTVGGHYAQARATDSALVVAQPPKNVWNLPNQEVFVEKFLFYRGVGKFDLPLNAIFDDSGDLTLANTIADPVTAAIRIDVKGDRITVSEFGAVAPGAKATASSQVAMDMNQLSKRVSEILVAEGLYQKEADSMVNTWKRSWFGEEGSRVLYIVPPNMTDELLPLTVKPVPDETLRVLVGRMELMSPEDEKKYVEAVRLSSLARMEFTNNEGNKGKPFPISDGIRSFGRMTEPALVRVSKIADDAKIRREAEWLIDQIRAE
ncbi:MAG: hypothetical protein AAGG48_27120 [Planctomycetota bacterium]